MTFTPRLVALDIDGTLVDAAEQASAAVIDAVAAAADAGAHVVLATGGSSSASLRKGGGLVDAPGEWLVGRTRNTRIVRSIGP